MGLEGDPATGEHFYELATRTPKPGGQGRQWRGPDWRFLCSGGYLQSCDIDLVDQHFPDQLQLLRAEGLDGAIEEIDDFGKAAQLMPRSLRIPATGAFIQLQTRGRRSPQKRTPALRHGLDARKRRNGGGEDVPDLYRHESGRQAGLVLESSSKQSGTRIDGLVENRRTKRASRSDS
jgi:hypothetical protein